MDVSRETYSQLQEFSDLVMKWTTKINLISPSTIPDIWNRHIEDSMQVYKIAPPDGRWIDLGTGGGFPGVVTAIMSANDCRQHSFTFVESDKRKAAFLRTTIGAFKLNATVKAERIDGLAPLGADILSARALAPLPVLLSYAALHMKADGVAFLFKGRQWEEEHAAAQREWSYDCDAIPSKTDPNAVVLKIKDITRV